MGGKVLDDMPRKRRDLGVSTFAIVFSGMLSLGTAQAATPDFHSQAIFPPEPKHNHASCLIATARGHFLAAWYSGSGERKSDDVVIEGAWLVPGRASWGPRFLMADTPGYPDCNPALFGYGGLLWLFWPTILDHRWEGALLKYQVTDRPLEALRPIRWARSGVIHVTPDSAGFAAAMEQSLATLTPEERARHKSDVENFKARSRDLLYQRLGWMPRVHPIFLSSNLEEKHPGRWILPLYSDTFSTSIMAFSDDEGKTWQTGRPMIGFGNIQPSLVRRKDKSLLALMRDNGPHHKIRRSTSSDDGMTWIPAVDTALPNPGSGIEVLMLRSGNFALIYNDTPRGRHSLAVSLSDDEGETWKWTRHIERREPGKGSFHYPSITQAWEGETIHATYTHSVPGEGSTIMYARFNEDWVRQGDGTK
jgi:predicted neuraminidase